jgi:hypothetical protein
MIVGFTGTASGMTEHQQAELYGTLCIHPHLRTGFRHGDCVGADAEAHAIALELGWPVVIHPPANPKRRAYCDGGVVKGPRPYLVRNHDIVDACDFLIAAPRQRKEVLRSGTWATVRYARKVGKEVIILEP